jgi:uncharacterized integral membrane protein (TIGR00698 family)
MTQPPPRRPLFANEDWCAIALGWLVLLVALGATWLKVQTGGPHVYNSQKRSAMSPEELARADDEAAKQRKAQLSANPIAPWIAKLSSWDADPRGAFVSKEGTSLVGPLLAVLVSSTLLFSLGLYGMGAFHRGFVPAFVGVFLLAVLAYVLAGQNVVKHYNLEYALWALVVGLIISNTLGTPAWLRPALRTELYIKTGLVLLGAEILLYQLLALGLPGVFVAWVVTPIVLISTYLFGQYVLKIPSRSLNMVISADMSVCGVSAAIATAAACKAKKEELSLAIGLSLSFTVVMMVLMPLAIEWLGIGPVLGGAWIGGTIDSTGAVAAAGGMLGETALAVAATIKMIQNILIGVVAFGVAVYWVTWVEADGNSTRPQASEIWRRFPKFVLGFVAASVFFSLLATRGLEGEGLAKGTTSVSVGLRNWFFCLAFVSIGLETNFRQLRQYMVGGKPLILYVCGQSLNLLLTFLMAWLMFEKVFPHAAQALSK